MRTSSPSTHTYCVSRVTAAQRTGVDPEERRREQRTGEARNEEKSRWKDGLSPLQQAGLYSAVSARFIMPLGSKRLAGITALVASLLLGSCGIGGKGERLCALFGEPMLYHYTKNSLTVRADVG